LSVAISRGMIQCAAAVLLVASLCFSGRPAKAEPVRELVFGMSAAFTGANGELGIEFYRGLMAYLEYLNANGGAEGWTIRVIPANDGYDLTPCFKNTHRFIEDDNVFALFSYVGTPTTTHILPLLQKYDDRDMFLLFPLTGAQPLRTVPFGKYVYNLRASYFDETAGLVDRLVAVGRTRIAVFYQSDAYGRTGWDGVRRALTKYELPIVAEAAYRRGATFEHDFSGEALHLMKASPDAIVVVGTYASQGAFVRDARDQGYTGPIAGLSFADSGKMLELLKGAEGETGREYSRDLIHSQVVPDYKDLNLPGARLYRRVMGKYKGLPLDGREGYKPRRFSYVSFEGFLNGMVLGEMVSRMADDPRRERIPEILESLYDFDLGVNRRLNFGSGCHQGLDAVYFTTVVDGQFRPLADWERWRQ